MSAGCGKSFQAKGREYGHILDPRTGAPADCALLAVVATECATDTDALSTALLTLGSNGLRPISQLRPGLRALVVATVAGTDHGQVVAHGVSLLGS